MGIANYSEYFGPHAEPGRPQNNILEANCCGDKTPCVVRIAETRDTRRSCAGMQQDAGLPVTDARGNLSHEQLASGLSQWASISTWQPNIQQVLERTEPVLSAATNAKLCCGEASNSSVETITHNRSNDLHEGSTFKKKFWIVQNTGEQ